MFAFEITWSFPQWQSILQRLSQPWPFKPSFDQNILKYRLISTANSLEASLLSSFELLPTLLTSSLLDMSSVAHGCQLNIRVVSCGAGHYCSRREVAVGEVKF